MSHIKNSHCSFCGAKFLAPVRRHAICTACGSDTWINSIPASVIVLPVQAEDGRFGVLLVRRGIAPHIGQWALPGGFVEPGEAFEAAALRELCEEALELPDSWPVHLTHSRSAHHEMSVAFCVAHPVGIESLPDPFVPNEETQEIKVVYEPVELCFETHTEALRLHFERLRRASP